jgi:hypothetical protein
MTGNGSHDNDGAPDNDGAGTPDNDELDVLSDSVDPTDVGAMVEEVIANVPSGMILLYSLMFNTTVWFIALKWKVTHPEIIEKVAKAKEKKENAKRKKDGKGRKQAGQEESEPEDTNDKHIPKKRKKGKGKKVCFSVLHNIITAHFYRLLHRTTVMKTYSCP